MTLAFEGYACVEPEDGGAALILELPLDDNHVTYVQLRSWDLTTNHPDLQPLVGQLLRVTVEIINP